MQERYRLIGVMSIVGILPDFVFPIFEKDGKYYFINGDEETLKIESFVEVEKCAHERIVPLNNLKTNEIYQRDFTKESEPIFAFQSSEIEVFIGFFKEIKAFLQSFETDNEILREDIEDFINNTGTK